MSIDLATSPARYYVEKEQNVVPSNVEFSNNAGNLIKEGISKDRVATILSHLSRFRLLQSVDVGEALTQYNAGILGDEIKAVEEDSPRDELKPTKGSSLTVTSTNGRKLFIQHDNLKRLFKLPGTIAKFEDTNKVPILSVKGVGSPFARSPSKDELRETEFIKGYTGSTYEPEIEEKLTDGSCSVKSLSGEEKEKEFIPGRYYLGSADITHISTSEGQTMKVDNLDKEEYPLLSKETKRKALFHVCWSRLNYDDFDYLAKVYSKGEKDLDETSIRELGEKKDKIFLNWTEEILKNLGSHPDFQGFLDDFSIEDLKKDGDILADFWSKYFVAQLEKDYTEAQVVARKKIKLAHPHTQNYSFGGQQDFEGSTEVKIKVDEDERETEKEIFNYQWKESIRTLQSLLSSIFKLIPTDQLDILKQKIVDQAGNYESVDSAKLAGWLNAINSDSDDLHFKDWSKEVFSIELF